MRTTKKQLPTLSVLGPSKTVVLEINVIILSNCESYERLIRISDLAAA